MVETIYALSSGKGRAGVAIIRTSGPQAIVVANCLVKTPLVPRRAVITDIIDPRTGGVIDKGIVIWFPGPASFTGEDVVEYHVHGGRAVIAAILDTLSSFDELRAADPGEFTRRAFVNGKLDLTSAEGLADLVAADTELQRRQALGQLSGAASELGQFWRKSLIEAQALVEASLDFPDEAEIPRDVRVEVGQTLESLIRSFDHELRSRRQAEIVRDGGFVLLAGPPNAGKSTLLNRIAERDVAIISEQPGTTRDLIEITVDIKGVPVIFIDSAGLREASDPIERQGIERTRARANKCHLVIWLVPADQPLADPDIIHRQLQIVRTKSDLTDQLGSIPAVSALTGEGITEFLNLVYELLMPEIEASEPAALTTIRQFECVSNAKQAVERSRERLYDGDLELTAEELRHASRHLAELSGAIFPDDLLDEVFGRFCLGK